MPKYTFYRNGKAHVLGISVTIDGAPYEDGQCDIFDSHNYQGHSKLKADLHLMLSPKDWGEEPGSDEG